MLGRTWRLLLSLFVSPPDAPPVAPSPFVPPPLEQAAPILFEITLWRAEERGLFGFVLEPNAVGSLIAELAPSLPAEPRAFVPSDELASRHRNLTRMRNRMDRF